MPHVVFEDEEPTTRVNVNALDDHAAEDVPTMPDRPSPRPVTLPPMRPPTRSGVVVRAEPVTLSLNDRRRELEPWEEERQRGA